MGYDFEKTTIEIVELIAKAEQLLALLEPLEKRGDESATLFADHVRLQLSLLRKAIASGDSNRLSSILLDIVPNAKDLDAIDFRLDLHPDIEALRSDIRYRGGMDCETSDRCALIRGNAESQEVAS